jgi:hypothetical protein
VYPPDPLDVQAQVPDHVLDVADPLDVFQRKQSVPRVGAVSNNQARVLLFPHRGHRKPELLCEDTDGNHRVVNRPLVICFRHNLFDSKALAEKGASYLGSTISGIVIPTLYSKAIQREK